MNTNEKIKLILLGAASAIFVELKKENLDAICDIHVSDTHSLLAIRIEKEDCPLNVSWLRTNTADELVGDKATISFLEDLTDK